MKWLLALMAVLCVFAILGCEEEKRGTNLDDGCPPWCIGPEGGEIEITDPESHAYGVKVTIPPGAWDHCRALQIEDEYVVEEPFATGFKPYEGYWTMFDIYAGGSIPDSLYMEFTFPVHNIAPDSLNFLCAYYFDEDSDKWRIVLPDAVTDSTMTVCFHLYKKKWSWGRIGLYEVDYEYALEPLLMDVHGQDQWLRLEQELAAVYDAVIEEDLALTCATVLFIHEFFDSLRAEATLDLHEFQDGLGGACGVCDVTSGEFYSDFIGYALMRLDIFLMNLVFVENGPKLLIQVYGFMRICEILAEIEELACDYDCFFAQFTEDFYVSLMLFYTSFFVVEIIEYAVESGYVDCPPGNYLEGPERALTRIFPH